MFVSIWKLHSQPDRFFNFPSAPPSHHLVFSASQRESKSLASGYFCFTLLLIQTTPTTEHGCCSPGLFNPPSINLQTTTLAAGVVGMFRHQVSSPSVYGVVRSIVALSLSRSSKTRHSQFASIVPYPTPVISSVSCTAQSHPHSRASHHGMRPSNHAIPPPLHEPGHHYRSEPLPHFR